MALDNAPETSREVTIAGLVFSVSTPYVAGHQITEAEAKALNQVRIENIRNNLAARIKEAKEKHGDNEKALRKETEPMVAEYDSSYEFTLASVGGGGRKMDPIEKEARRIARELISLKLKEKGVTQKAYLEEHGENAIKDKIEEIWSGDEIMAMAKEAVEARSRGPKLAEELSI